MEVQILSTAPFLYSRLFPKDAVVVERQTRHFEGVVGEIPYGFKSHRPHQIVNADVVQSITSFLFLAALEKTKKIAKKVLTNLRQCIILIFVADALATRCGNSSVVEHLLAKEGVASSNLVFRST